MKQVIVGIAIFCLAYVAVAINDDYANQSQQSFHSTNKWGK